MYIQWRGLVGFKPQCLRQGTTKSVGTSGVSLESHNQPLFFLFFFVFLRNTISLFYFYFRITILHIKKYKGQCPYASRTSLLFTRHRSQLILVKLIKHLISYHKIFLILRAKLYCYSIIGVIHQLLIISSINYNYCVNFFHKFVNKELNWQATAGKLPKKFLISY